MRRLVMKTVVGVIAASFAIAAVPVLVVLAWFVVEQRRSGAYVPQISTRNLFWIILGMVSLLVVVAQVVGFFLAGQVSERVSAPLDVLAARAERLGGGKTMPGPATSGIEEIDRLSEVFTRSAQQVSRNLAVERVFATDASHQLRTPLTALLMRLEEIATSDDLEVVRAEANIAISQVERLTRVVDELLARTRTNTVQRPTVSVDTVLAAMQREWQPAFGKARRSVQITGERNLRVRATSNALSQIFSTLLENSLQHGGGTVRVVVRRAGPSVVIEVSDRGPGIDPSIAQHIFERSVSSSGSGLGLTLARDLAESNGGRLELLSTQSAHFALFLSEADDEEDA